MTATPCAIDGRLTQDGHVCGSCLSRPSRQLAEIIDLTPDARAVARGEVRRGGGGAGGKPGSRPPLNDGATDAVHEVQNMITTLAREIADTRGLKIGRDGKPQPAESHAAGRTGRVGTRVHP